MEVKYFRKLDSVLVIAVTVTGRDEQRQTLTGVNDLSVRAYQMDGDPIDLPPSGEVFLDEVFADPSTWGDVRYVLDLVGLDPPPFLLAAYKFEFWGTINGELTPFPEKGHIIVEFN